MKALLIRPLLVVAMAFILTPGALLAQEMVLNGGFENGGEGWEIFNVAAPTDVAAEIDLSTDPAVCPSNGSGNCMVVTAPGGYTNNVLFQELTLIAGTPYEFDADFRQLGDTLVETWVEFYLSPQAPVMNTDYQPAEGILLAFNTWTGCGYGDDGSFREDACVRNEEVFVPAGTAGEEVSIFVGIKAGTLNANYPMSFSLDNVSVTSAGETFAIALFSREPLYRVPVNYEVAFDATESSGSSAIATYEWDFGDGTTGSGATTTHAFAEEGTYTVRLTVTGEDGGTGTVSSTINVFEGTGSLVMPLEIPRATTPPTIDGQIDDVWETAQTISMESPASGPAPDSEADLSGTVSLLWDADAIYGLFQVQDDVLMSDSGGDTWQDDGVEFYIDALNEKLFEGYDDNDAQFTMNWDSDQFSGGHGGRIEGASYVVEEVEGGYVLEFVIPWAGFEMTFDVGHEIGIEAMINDDDDGGARDHKLAWFALPGVDNAYQHAHLFGTAVLVEELTGTAAEPEAGIPGSFSIESVYPNPFNPSTTAMLSVREVGEYSVRVFDLLGRLVQEQTLNATAPGQIAVPISLEDQASGIYMISVEHTATSARATTRVMLVK